MKAEYYNTLYLAIAFLTLFGFAEFLHLVIKLRGEVTRKIVHIGTGALTMAFPVFLRNHWLVLILCSSFAILLSLSLKFNFLKGINAIDRKSHGSISYPAAVYLAYLFYDYQTHYYLFFYLPILLMAFGDPVAAFVGKRTGFISVNIMGEQKTVGGFLGFTVIGIATSLILYYTFPCPLVNPILLALACSIVGALTELITPKGLDNITIPLSVIGSIWLLLHI